MGVGLLSLVVKRIAAALAGRATAEVLERTTGREAVTPGEVATKALDEIADEVTKILGKPPEEAETDEVINAVERGVNEGRIRPERLREAENELMVDYNTFMSVFMEQCASGPQYRGEGSGPRRNSRFKEGVALWNEQKPMIEQMTVAELKERLNCP